MAKINTPRVNNRYHITETVKILELPNRLNICELCGNRGHYDYQCQFATDFMQRMQKAFQCSHYMHDTNQDQEWSQGDDHNDQEQPFQ